MNRDNDLKIISTRTHGCIDYAVATFMIAAPWLLRFNRGGLETTSLVLIGVASVFYSAFTRYELGLVKVIPMKIHLTLDKIIGLLLILSPWLLGFAHDVALPHVLFGVAAILISSLTQTRPVSENARVSS